MNAKALYESIMKNVTKEVRKALNESATDEVAEAWQYLIDTGIATNEEVQLVTDINGLTVETLEDILYARTGYRSFDQLDDFETDKDFEEDED